MKLVIWCDTERVATVAYLQDAAPGLAVAVHLDVELPYRNPGASYDRDDYCMIVQPSPRHPDETLLVVNLGPRWSDTLRAAGELEMPTPLGFTLHLCEKPE